MEGDGAETGLADLLAALKRRSGRSYEALARRSGVSRSTLHRWCTGQSVSDRFALVERYARVCGADRGELTRLRRCWVLLTEAARPVTGPGPLARPAQLPSRLAAFTGRRAALAALDALVDDRCDGPADGVSVVAVTGMAGVGKTTLAVRWAHQNRELFPDGQLYVDLRGFDPAARPLNPADAVRGFLEALGTPGPRLPIGADAQVGLYRSLLAERRMLVLIDNARDADQVRPLLPGTPGCLALVTSRSRLIELIATDAAHPVALDPLTDDEAHELLRRRLGEHRCGGEPQAVARIVRECAGLPLALTLAAARAVASPAFPLAAFA